MKKTIRIISITGLILLAVLTFVSRSVYNKSLPQVTAVKLDRGYVPLTWETIGTLVYPNETILKSGGTWTVSEVLVQAGDVVREGQPLCRFDTRTFDIERQTLELDVLRLQNTLDTLDKWNPQTAGDQLSKEHQQGETTASLKIAEERLEYALSQEPPEKGLFAPCAGMVYGLTAKPGGTFLYGDALLSLLPDETPQLSFSLPPNEGKAFGSAVLVEATVETVNRRSDGEAIHHQIVPGRVVSEVLRGGQWECLATLDNFEGQIVGLEVPLRASQQGEMQNAVVPLNCLFSKDNGKVVYVINSRPGLFGEENYLTEVSVGVLYDNGGSASLICDLSGGTMLASDPSRPVNDGDVIWVRD